MIPKHQQINVWMNMSIFSWFFHTTFIFKDLTEQIVYPKCNIMHHFASWKKHFWGGANPPDPTPLPLLVSRGLACMRALYKVFFSRYPHLSFISLIHNPLILHSVFSLSRALYNLSHLYYPLYHFRDVFLCFQILFITKALFFKCFKYDLRNTKL